MTPIKELRALLHPVYAAQLGTIADTLSAALDELERLRDDADLRMEHEDEYRLKIDELTADRDALRTQRDALRAVVARIVAHMEGTEEEPGGYWRALLNEARAALALATDTETESK